MAGLTKAEQEELARLEALDAKGQLAPAAPQGLTETERQELAQLESQYAEKPVGVKDVALGGLDLLGRALDLPGGLLRVGAGKAAELATGNDNIVTKEDLYNALVGRAPTTAKMMERGGVGEMGSVELPLLGRVTGRGALGFAGDVASGVGAGMGLGALAGGEGILAGTARALNAPNEVVGQAMNAAGQGMYRGAYKNLDRAAELMGKGKTAVSDVLRKNKWWGGSQATEDFTRELSDRLSKQVEDKIAQNSIEGGTVDVVGKMQLMKQEAEKMLAEQHTPEVHAQLKSYIGKLDNIIGQGQVPGVPVMPQQLAPGVTFNEGKYMATEVEPTTGLLLKPKPIAKSNALIDEVTPAMERPFSTQSANNIKQELYNDIGGEQYGLLSKSPVGKRLMKSAVRSVKEGIEQQVPEVAGLNQDLGALLSAKKKIAQEATSAIRQNAGTTVGFMSMRDPALAALKHLGDLSKMTAARSGGGLLLQNPAVQSATEQALIEASGRGNADDNLSQVIERIKQKYGTSNK